MRILLKISSKIFWWPTLGGLFGILDEPIGQKLGRLRDQGNLSNNPRLHLIPCLTDIDLVITSL